MKAVNQRYTRELIASIVAYGIMLVGAMWLTSGPLAESNLRFVVVLLPMIPIIFTLQAIVRFLNGTDELERELQLKSLAISFAGTAFLTFTYGFLEMVGLPRISMFAVWPLMAAIWVIARFILNRQYQ
ncbi:MAG: hypothetical protein AAGD96_11785 [Chloroflexota bacterium]